MANVVLMAMEIDGGDRQRPLADGDTVANLNFNSGLFNQLRTDVGLNVPVGQDGLPLLSGLSAALLEQLAAPEAAPDLHALEDPASLVWAAGHGLRSNGTVDVVLK